MVFKVEFTEEYTQELAKNYSDDDKYELTQDELDEIADIMADSPCVSYLCEDFCDAVSSVMVARKEDK